MTILDIFSEKEIDVFANRILSSILPLKNYENMKAFICGMLALVFCISGVSADINVAPINDNRVTIRAARIEILGGTVSNNGQKNVYPFTAPIDGRYRFEMAELRNNARVSLYVFNYLGETMASTSGGNGSGLTLNELVKGQTYEIQVRQSSGFSSYNLIIGQQKETVNVYGVDRINDSTQYTDQRNVYSFTAAIDGRYRFEMAELRNNARVSLYVFNYLGETIASTSGGNGSGLTLNELVKGQTYEIQIRQTGGFSGYKLNIIKQ
jgi:hypothetical protein